MGWLTSAASGFTVAISDGTVWLSIGQALLFAAVCLVFGILVARLVGLLKPGAPAAETVGVGLASGLLVLAAWWAAIASGGRSSFTPVAVGFAIAIALAVVRSSPTRRGDSEPIAARLRSNPRHRRRERRGAGASSWRSSAAASSSSSWRSSMGRPSSLSPRDGVQPVEFMDEAFYSILGAELARTGPRPIYPPSGFSDIEGLPAQTWYHWGEMWLEAAVITVFGAAPLDARHFVVLPVMLLAAAVLTGTLVRRLTGSRSRGAFLFGFLACLFLAPVPLIPGPYFSSRAVGLIFGITTTASPRSRSCCRCTAFAVLGGRRASWALAAFVGSAAAMILPAHIAIAALALVGVGAVWAVRIGQSLLATGRLPEVTPVWRQTSSRPASPSSRRSRGGSSPATG